MVGYRDERLGRIMNGKDNLLERKKGMASYRKERNGRYKKKGTVSLLQNNVQ
jgi:hypothetical protein